MANNCGDSNMRKRPDIPENSLKPLAVTVPVALQITGIGRTTLYGLIEDGTLESVTVRRRRLINFASLERLTSARNTPPSI
jgi:excisionase family DNA binding protein